MIWGPGINLASDSQSKALNSQSMAPGMMHKADSEPHMANMFQGLTTNTDAQTKPNQSQTMDLFNMLNQNISQTTTHNAPTIQTSSQFQLSMSETDTHQVPKHEKKMDDLNIIDDEFEELSESREIIEHKIFRLKLQMIDHTISQQEISN